jgi:hypothetical protein
LIYKKDVWAAFILDDYWGRFVLRSEKLIFVRLKKKCKTRRNTSQKPYILREKTSALKKNPKVGACTFDVCNADDYGQLAKTSNSAQVNPIRKISPLVIPTDLDYFQYSNLL